MLRFRDAICLCFVLLLVFGTLFHFQGHSWLSSNVPFDAMHRSDARREAAIPMSDRWTEFKIPGDAFSIRIFSNAVVHDDAGQKFTPTLAQPRRGYRYAVEYEFLDDQLNSLKRGVYHFRSNVKEKTDRESGEVIQPIQIVGVDAAVAQTRVMQASLDAEIENARAVRLKIAEVDDGVQEVLTRVIYQSKRRDHDRYGAWEKISDHRKEQLAKHSVFEHHLLDQNSRTGLLKWDWSRATTVGETERRFLYFVGDNNDLEFVDEPFPQGVIVQPGWKVVVPVSDDRATLRVEATPLTKGASIQGQLHYRFEDSETGLQKFASQNFASSQQTVSSSVEINDVTGLVEIETECPAALRMWVRNPMAGESDEWTEIEMEPKHCSVYIADHRPVAFSVGHFGDQVTPLKVAFRFAEEGLFDEVVSKSSLTRSRRVTWKYINDAGQTVQQGVKDLAPVVSAHERFWTGRTTFAVTDAINLWFPVPANVARVEFYSEESPALVNAYTRPQGLPAQTRVPEDYHVIQRLNSPYRRWFIVRPHDHQAYVSGNRVLNLGVQNRLPEVVNDEQKNRVWRRFLPQGDWLASRIMVPAVDPLETREEEKPDSVWLWHEMVSGNELAYNLLARSSHYRNIKVAYVSDVPAGIVKVWCNNNLVASRDFASARGEFEVTLSDVQGVLRIEFADGVRVFTSSLETDSSHAYYRRTAMRVGSSPTIFDYEKKSSEDELLTLTLYRDESETDRAAIKVKVVPQVSQSNSNQPQDMWTVRDRSYDLRPLPVASSLLIDRSGNLDSGSRCFIKLGSDMPPGKYTIEVQREDALAGYLLLYQTVATPTAVRRVGIFDNRDLQ